ncbi:MAG TPA: polysaccharide biosynthesis tyrosine autokinase [Gemmatimonadales bacterium]|nr:polysaccharide biosynthesis tyrosine autokinase [Gemmatimonadales bacterium]
MRPDVDWGRYGLALRRYKWAVLVATLLGAVAGFGAARLVKSVYSARASVWIEAANQKAAAPSAGAWYGELLATTGWVELARSTEVLEPVVRDLKLYIHPQDDADSALFARFTVGDVMRAGAYRLEVDKTGQTFTLTTKGGRLVQRGAPGDVIGGPDLGWTWSPPAAQLAAERRVDFTVEQPVAAAVRLGGKLRVKTDLDGNFLRLELRGSNPAQVTATVNSAARRVVTVAGELKKEQLSELVSILAEQLKRSRQNLTSAEAALEQYLGRTVSFVTGGAGGAGGANSSRVTPGLEFARDPALASYFDMKVSVELIHRDRMAIARALAQVSDSGIAVDELAAIESVDRSTELAAALKDLTAKRAELRALRYRYTDAHVPVQRLAGEVRNLERTAIPRLAGAVVAGLAAREADLTQRINATSATLHKIPPLAIEEEQLRRNVANADRLFSSVQQRYDEARLAEATSIPDVQVLDLAVEPETPAIRTGPFLMFAGLVGGFGFGMLVAVIRDRSDPKFRYPQQVTEAMGLPILGVVPRVVHNGGNGGESTLRAIEALRGVRLNVVHAHGTAGPVLLTITSPGRSDGKSFVACNLALSFAVMGAKTLLIDGDVRRGGLHRLLSAARKPGLTDVLAGKLPLDEVIQATPYPGLSFIGCGSRTTNGPELLGTAAMAQVMAELRTRYQVIVLDSPPLSAGVDAYVLGTLTSTMLMVLRAGVSDREMAEAKLDVLDRLPVRMLGAVLNDVEPGGTYRYYSYYLEGYEAREELEGPRARVLRKSD